MFIGGMSVNQKFIKDFMKKIIHNLFWQTEMLFGFKRFSAIAVVLLLLVSDLAYGDCGRATCNYIGDPSAATTAWQFVSGSVPNGTTYNRYDFFLTSGRTYEFSLCSADGGAANYDSYLCLYGYGYGCGYSTFLAYNDDNCGTQSKITITATTTGWTSLYISGYSTYYGNYTLAYRYTSPCTTPGTPVSLSGSGTSTTTANLSWSAGSPAGSTTVTYYWNLYTSGGTFVASGNTTGTSATASGLSCGSSYYFTVYALTSCNSTQSSAATSSTFSTTACDMIVPATGSNSYTTCSGHLYDSGGPSADYGNNQDGYTIIYPGTAGNAVQISGSYVTESCCEHIYIYDGAGTGGTLLYNGGNGTGTMGPITSSGPNVPLTVRFTTDVSVIASGFDFTVSCITPCVATLTISGPTIACSSTSISYSAAPSGFAGTPTYQWYCNGTALAASGGGSAPNYSSYSGGTSQTLSVVTFAGTYTPVNWYCVATYGTCSATSNTISLSVPAATPSAPAAGTHSVSQTQVVWNWSTVSGATGYKWSTTNNYATATDVGTSITRTETGLSCGTSYTRYVWAYNTCGYSSATTLSATTTACCTTPVISNMTTSVCSGSPFSVTPVNGINGTVPAGTTYSWAAPTVSGISGTTSGSGASAISGTLINSTAGTVNVVYTVTPVSGTCTGAAFTVTVPVLPLPTASISPNPVPQFCYGGSQTLTASTGCGSPSYLWYRNGTSTGTTTSTYSATLPGLYSVRITCGGCANTSAPVTVVVQSNEFTLNVSQPATAGLSTGDYVWSGNTSIDWHVASNWLVYNGAGVYSVAAAIPDSTKNVFIRPYTGCASNLCNILNSFTGKCRNITIESSLTMNSVCYLEVARNWTNTLGILNPGSGTVIFNGRKNTTGTIYTGGDGAGKQFYNVEIKSESNSSLGSNDGNKVNLEGNIRINNNFVLTSGYQFNVNSSSLMSVGGNFTHNICEFNRGLGAVTLTGSGKVIDGSAATYFRILNITGSYTLNATHMYLWSNPNGDYGDINIMPGGTFNASSNTVHIDGSWTNNGTFTASTSTVSFERGFDQFVKSGGSSFYNFTVTKTATPPYVTLTDPARISNYGNFIYGIVNYNATGSLTFTDNATSNGGAEHSFVDGYVRKTGNESFLFPVGDITAIAAWQPHVWAPLAINNTAGTATDQFACEYFFTAAPNNWGSQYMCDFTLLNHVSGIEYWDLDRTIGSSAPSVTLYWKNAVRSGIQNPSGVVVAHWENCPVTMTDKWASKGGTVVEDIAGVAGHVTNTIAFPNFSPVTFGTIINNNSLPVEILSYSAACNEEVVEIRWTTASESNNDYFSLEHSPDAISWQALAMVSGAGNSSMNLDYEYTDNNPYSGINYYRLIQTDFNGQKDTIGIVSAGCGQSGATVSYYPNPFTSELTIQMDNIVTDRAVVQIFDALGQLVYTRILNAEEIEGSSVVFDLSGLAPGMYSVEFSSYVFISTRKIVRQQ